MTVMVHLSATGRVLRAAWGNPPVIELSDGTRVTMKDESEFEWCGKCERMQGDHAFDCPERNEQPLRYPPGEEDGA